MEYRKIEISPENIIVSVVWGIQSEKPEYGQALRFLDIWYIYGEANSHANGKSCARPDGWLPTDRRDWTNAERTLCDRLVLSSAKVRPSIQKGL